MGEWEEFERGMYLILKNITFDNDVTVNVFETTIRELGLQKNQTSRFFFGWLIGGKKKRRIDFNSFDGNWESW